MGFVHILMTYYSIAEQGIGVGHLSKTTEQENFATSVTA